MQNKNVTSPLVDDWGTIVGLLLVIVIGSLASTAGVGGGAIFVPLFQALVGFPLKESTALSQALITAGSLVSVAFNIFSPSPLDYRQPLIDFPLVLLLTPMLLVGVGIGVLLNYILPAYVISILLVMLMALLTAQSLGKGVRMWRSETAARRQSPLDCIPVLEGGHDVSAVQRCSQEEASRASCNIIGNQSQELQEREDHGSGACRLSHGQGVQQCHQEIETQPLLKCVTNASSPNEYADLTSIINRGRSAPSQEASNSPVKSQLTSSIINSAALQLLVGISRSSSPFESPLLSSMTTTMMPTSSEIGGGRERIRRGSAWVNRRNAWMTGFLRNCSEHVQVESVAIQRHVLVPMPMPTLQETYEKEDAQDVSEILHDKIGLELHEGIHGEVERSSRRRWLQRSSSMPSKHCDPLLCAAEMAEALAPRRIHHVDTERRRLTADCTDEDLLKLIIEEEPSSLSYAEQQQQRTEEKFDPSYVGVIPSPCTTLSNSCSTVVEPRATGPAEFSTFSMETTACPGMVLNNVDGAQSHTLCSYLIQGWERIPTRVVLFLGLCWLTYVSLQLGHSLSKVCSSSYWGTLAAQIVAMSTFSAGVTWWLTKKSVVDHKKDLSRSRNSTQPQAEFAEELAVHHCALPGVESGQQEQSGIEVDSTIDVEACSSEIVVALPEEPTLPQDLGSEEKGSGSMRFILFQGFAFIAGLIGGLLGLGGGMVIGPMLLHLGIHPQIGAASSGTMVLFSSSTALIAFSVSGRLNLQYAAVFSLASMVAALLGSLVIGGIIRRTGRVSLLVLSMAAIMLIGGGAVAGFGVVIIIQAIQDKQLGPSSLCS